MRNVSVKNWSIEAAALLLRLASNSAEIGLSLARYSCGRSAMRQFLCEILPWFPGHLT